MDDHTTQETLARMADLGDDVYAVGTIIKIPTVEDFLPVMYYKCGNGENDTPIWTLVEEVGMSITAGREFTWDHVMLHILNAGVESVAVSDWMPFIKGQQAC